MRSTLSEVATYLLSALDVPVYTQAPGSRPEAYVLVAPAGGTPSLDALHHDYALQAWATTYDGAEALIRQCCDAMRSYGSTPYADMVPLGMDETHYWWQATFTVHALW